MIAHLEQQSGIWRIPDKRWMLPIWRSVATKEITRFGELKRSLSGISSTTLSERLQ